MERHVYPRVGLEQSGPHHFAEMALHNNHSLTYSLNFYLSQSPNQMGFEILTSFSVYWTSSLKSSHGQNFTISHNTMHVGVIQVLIWFQKQTAKLFGRQRLLVTEMYLYQLSFTSGSVVLCMYVNTTYMGSHPPFLS